MPLLKKITSKIQALLGGALPINDSAIVNSRAEMNACIDAFVKHRFEQLFFPNHEPIYVAYEDLENVTLSLPYSRSTATKNVVKLSNLGDTAMVAKVGRTSPVESAVNRADYSVRTKITTPSEHKYTKAQLGSGITFEEMEKPVANSLDEIDLQVGDQHTLSLDGKFSGKFIEDGYTLNGVETDKISVARGSDNDTYIITAIKWVPPCSNSLRRTPLGVHRSK